MANHHSTDQAAAGQDGAGVGSADLTGWYIYTLSEPDGEKRVRYVGKTDNPKNRLARHISLSDTEDTHKGHWIRKLVNAGQRPVMTIVQVGVGGSWEVAERAWITELRQQGASLTNHTDGGEGLSGHTHTPEARAKMSIANRGKSKSAEHRAKLSRANKGKRFSEERKAALSVARKADKQHMKQFTAMAQAYRGTKHTAESKAKMSKVQRARVLSPGAQARVDESIVKMAAANRGKKLTSEHRANISAGLKGGKRTAETRAKMSAAQKRRFQREREEKAAAEHGDSN
jgi:hypothetical protein